MSFDAIEVDETIIIGKGKKQAPPRDRALDPVEGTRLLALGRPNAIAVRDLLTTSAKPGLVFCYIPMAMWPAHSWQWTPDGKWM